MPKCSKLWFQVTLTDIVKKQNLNVETDALNVAITVYITRNRKSWRECIWCFTNLMHEFIYCGTTVTTMDVIVLFFYWIVMHFINYCQKLQLVVAVCEMRERKKYSSLLEFYWIDISWRYRYCALLSIVLIYCVYYLRYKNVCLSWTASMLYMNCEL